MEPRYSAEVERRFRSLPGAGALPEGAGSVLRSNAGSAARGAVVELAARIDQGRIVDARFHAYGCPHLIAAASLACEQLCGRAVATLAGWDWAPIAAELEVPPAKYSRLLTLQDAVRRLGAAATGEGPHAV